MKKLLYVLQATDGGGVKQPLELARHMQELGWGIIVAAPDHLRHVAAVSVPALDVVPLPQDIYRRATFLFDLATQSSVVHAHGARAATWAAAALSVRPSVITFHGLHLLRRPRAGSHRMIARALTRTLVSLADEVICVARSEAVDLLRVAPRAKIRVVPNAVPPQPLVDDAERRQARRILGLDEGTRSVLFLGWLSDQKDPFTALRVVDGCEGSHLLLLAGEGPLLAELSRVLPPNARLLGHRQDVRTLMAAADVVLNTSLSEGLPLGLLEAMWSGIPIIASDAPGNVEAVGDTALVVPRGDVKAFRTSLLALRDGRRCARLAAAGRKRVALRFDHGRMLDDTAAVYERVLSRS